MPIISVTSITPLENYKLCLIFNDGTEGVYDASHLAGRGVFKAWDLNNNFDLVFIDPESGAITWPGDIDIDTINVYCTIKGISSDQFLNSLQHATYL